MSSLSSSSSISGQKYDVFLSFRGEDTRKKFTDHLYAALKRNEIVTFRDETELETGETIAQELSKAIQESWCSLIVISETYAFSDWCLDELAKIVEQRNKRGHKIFPIFYDVDPSDLRKQTGRVYEAFAEHEQRYKEGKEKIKRWRTALTEVANIKGLCLSNRPESEFIEDIVNMIQAKLNSHFKELHPKRYIRQEDVDHVLTTNRAKEAVEGMVLNKGNSNTEPVTYRSLFELEIGKPPGEIRVRVARTWYHINYKSNNNQVLSFDFLVTDEKGDALQASVTKGQADPFESQIEEGNVYIISGFRVTKQKSTYNAISAPCILTITSTTKIVQTEIPRNSISKHYFQFIEFEHLSTRCKNNDVLTDVIGRITSISELYVGTNLNKVQRRNLQLQNSRGETINVTLWGDLVLSVDEELVGVQTNPILILAAVTVTEYNRKTSIATCSASKLYLDLDIPNVAEMKARFQEQAVEPVQLLQGHQRPQFLQVEQENLIRVTVQKLLEIDHKKGLNTKYSCIAQIKYIDCAQGWHYSACKICLRSLVQFDEEIFWCQDHGERTPFPCYKLVMTVEDETNIATFIAFADVAEKLTGVIITKVALIGQEDKHVLPEPIGRKLINKNILFVVNIIKNSLETGDLAFGVISCCKLDEAGIPINVPCIASSFQIETTSKSDGKQLNNVEQQPKSPTKTQIPRDSFIEESLAKKLKFGTAPARHN